MTTARIYGCNLCSNRIDEKTGVGIYFGPNGAIEAKRSLGAVAHHMCRDCIGGLSRIWADINNKKIAVSSERYCPQCEEMTSHDQPQRGQFRCVECGGVGVDVTDNGEG